MQKRKTPTQTERLLQKSLTQNGRQKEEPKNEAVVVAEGQRKKKQQCERLTPRKNPTQNEG